MHFGLRAWAVVLFALHGACNTVAEPVVNSADRPYEVPWAEESPEARLYGVPGRWDTRFGIRCDNGQTATFGAALDSTSAQLANPTEMALRTPLDNAALASAALDSSRVDGSKRVYITAERSCPTAVVAALGVDDAVEAPRVHLAWRHTDSQHLVSLPLVHLDFSRHGRAGLAYYLDLFQVEVLRQGRAPLACGGSGGDPRKRCTEIRDSSQQSSRYLACINDYAKWGEVVDAMLERTTNAQALVLMEDCSIDDIQRRLESLADESPDVH